MEHDLVAAWPGREPGPAMGELNCGRDMSLYLVIHTPKPEDQRIIRKPTRLVELARASSVEGVRPRWIKTWTPDLHDDRLFSLWEAANAAEIVEALEHFGFLDDMTAQALNVREWGPADVLAAGDEPPGEPE